MKRAIVIGFGSIGQRHARLLAAMGFEIAIVSRRDLARPDAFASPADAMEGGADYAVIASETARHRADLEALEGAGFRGPVLIEKPVWQPHDPAYTGELPVRVGYVLRFHPVLQALREALAGARVHGAAIRCGSYLPDWRPGQDYRTTESARIEAGGGALRDLSHEIDYAAWLFGPFRRLTALGGRFGDLEIETDDTFTLLGETERAPLVSIALNYLDRPTERRIVVNAASGAFVADLVGGALRHDGREIAVFGLFDRDAAMIAQHEDAMRAAPRFTASLAEGLETLRTIAHAERASRNLEWITP
jgi:predicted dehydrogenase